MDTDTDMNIWALNRYRYREWHCITLQIRIFICSIVAAGYSIVSDRWTCQSLTKSLNRSKKIYSVALLFTVKLLVGCEIQHRARRESAKLVVAHRWYCQPGEATVERSEKRGLEGQDFLSLVPAAQTPWWVHQVKQEWWVLHLQR